MKNPRFSRQSGVSVIELVIVIVVLSILTAFAITLMGRSTNTLERENIAKSFKTSLDRARFDSVRRRASDCTNMSRVEITSATSFTVATDLNADGVLDAANETRTIDFSGNANVQLVDDPAPTYPITIRFDERGRTSSGPCGAEVATYTPAVFCTMPCTLATATAANADVVFVSSTGTTALMEGGAAIPTFDPPSVSSNTSSNTNPLLAVWDAITGNSNSNSNTNSNTNSNSNSNTNSNSNSGGSNSNSNGNTNSNTNSNSNSNSNSNTNSNNYCISGQYPGTNGCVCSPTQHLQGGKCRNNH